MNNLKIWLRQIINLMGYLGLQLVMNQTFRPFHQGCFIYIGFFLLLPWTRSNMIWQLLLGFAIGLLVDIFYDSLGIHTFTAVLILYLRNFLLYLLLPYQFIHLITIRPTLKNMGIQKFAIYIFLLITIYHFIVFAWNTDSLDLLFVNLPKLLLSSMVSYLLILLSQIFVESMWPNRSK